MLFLSRFGLLFFYPQYTVFGVSMFRYFLMKGQVIGHCTRLFAYSWSSVDIERSVKGRAEKSAPVSTAQETQEVGIR